MVTVNLTTPKDASVPPTPTDAWVLPGWSQEESVPSHVIGDTTGSVRQTSYTTRAASDTDLLVGQPVTVAGAFTSVGAATDVKLIGDLASIAVNDLDSKFLPNRKFPAVPSGFEESALDLVQRMYGRGGVTLPWEGGRGPAHAYYPLRGHSQGFTVDGRNVPYQQSTWDGSGYKDETLTPIYHGEHACMGVQFIRLSALATSPYCQVAYPIQSPLSNGTDVNYQAIRIFGSNQGAVINQFLQMNWEGLLSPPTIQIQYNRLGAAVADLNITGFYRQYGAGSNTAITAVSVPVYPSLDPLKELGMVVQWGYLTESESATLRVKAYMYDPTAPPAGAPVVVAQVDLVNAARPEGTENSRIQTGNAGSTSYQGFRDLIVSQTDNSWPVHYPVIPEPDWIVYPNLTQTLMNSTATTGRLSARRTSIPSWEGSGWEYLKMLCSARGLEMKINASGKLDVKTILAPPGVTQTASVTQRLTNLIDAPVLSIEAGNLARSVDVVAHTVVQGTTIFTTAEQYRLRDLSITMEEDSTSNIVLQLPPGEYFRGALNVTLVDSEEKVRDWYRIVEHGGSMEASIRNGNLLVLAIHGPHDGGVTSNIGPGPWTITEIGLRNMGFIEFPETITLYTGAPESMIGREKGGDVDNPFLGSTADVWNCSTWLISAEGSPRVTLSFTVSANDRSRYTVGQLVSYGWGVFRVMNVASGKSTSTISCEWFATQASQTANWTGLTANDWNTYWAGQRAYDVFLRPLASSAPVKNPQPFVRSYPSESK